MQQSPAIELPRLLMAGAALADLFSGRREAPKCPKRQEAAKLAQIAIHQASSSTFSHVQDPKRKFPLIRAWRRRLWGRSQPILTNRCHRPLLTIEKVELRPAAASKPARARRHSRCSGTFTVGVPASASAIRSVPYPARLIKPATLGTI